MMTITSQSIVQKKLPSMTATALIVLLVALRTEYHDARAAQVRASKARVANGASRKGKVEETPAVPVAIPPGVASCMKRLTGVCERLEREVQGASVAPDRQTLRRVARRYKLCWRSLRAFVNAFIELDAGSDFDPTALRAAAKTVLGGTRPLAFLREDDREVWSKGRQKLARVESDGLAAEVTALGGGVIVARLKACQDAFGDLLGVTAVKRERGTHDVGATMTQARELIQDYAIKVAAMIDEDVPGSAELAATLSAPIAALGTNKTATPKPAAQKDPAENTVTKPATPAPVPAPAPAPLVTPAEPLKPTGTG